jgi:homogentisate 1,2-dioxygenase
MRPKPNAVTTSRGYQQGFGNHFATEALPGALPVGRNSPQRAPLGLYAELVSGSAFTVPRQANHRSWLYRRLPSVVTGSYEPYEQPLWLSGAAAGVTTPPNPMRWLPAWMPKAGAKKAVDFVDGLRTMLVNGDVDAQQGVATHVYTINTSMVHRACVNADGEMLVVPQQGALRITTELGVLDVRPGMIALLPRGLVFKVALAPGETAARGYVGENHGADFRLPELGPIGSNGLANVRDFQAPVAAFEPDPPQGYEIIKRFGGRLWRTRQSQTPFNVVAWHGTLAPVRYDTQHFNTLGSISFDHPDPSIFTVLTSPSDTPGTANCDFVIFPPRWLVGEDTFRPPWFHRNVMSECMGLIHGQYDAKAEGFLPGGLSLHNAMVPHGPDTDAFAKASHAALVPQKLDHTLAFMIESRWRFLLTPHAASDAPRDARYADCWAGLKDQSLPSAKSSVKPAIQQPRSPRRKPKP